jgi:hypothetical protein
MNFIQQILFPAFTFWMLVGMQTLIPSATYAQPFRGLKTDWVLQIGGVGDDVSNRRILVDGDGNAIIVGTFESQLTIGPYTLTSSGLRDVFVSKVSSEGKVIWVNQIGGSRNEDVLWGRTIVDSRNAVILCIYSESSQFTVTDSTVNGSGSYNPRLVKYSPDGKPVFYGIDLWSQYLNGYPVELTKLHYDSYRDQILVGFAAWSLGDPAASIQMIGNDGLRKMICRFELATDSTRKLGWPRVQAITTDDVGDLYTAVLFDGELRLRSPDNSQRDTVLKGFQDVALIKLDVKGNTRWVKHIRGLGWEYVNRLKVIADRLFVFGGYGDTKSGYSSDRVDFDGGSLTRKSADNGFLGEYNISNGQLTGVSGIPVVSGPGDADPFGVIVDYDMDLDGDSLYLSGGLIGLQQLDTGHRNEYYKGCSFSLESICGRHYLLTDERGTLEMKADGSLVSRGGKDIFLALLKPPTNYVPVRPGLRFPVDSAVDLDLLVQVDWWWVGCANGYRLQLSRDSAMAQVVFDTTYALQPPFTLKNLEHLTKYYWRVRANTADTFSVWSDVRSFTTVKAQPADVVLEYPVNGSRGMQRQVTLRWTASKRASSYLVDVASDSAFANRVINGKLVSASALDVTLDANRTYYWRVRAGNAAGSSPWSEVWKFDVRPDAPARTILDKPSNGALQEPINTVFGWLSQGDGLEYRLHVARDSAFGFIDIDKTMSTAYWQGTLEPSATYFWRVRASNGYEDGAWSPTWSFSTGTTTSVDEDDSSPNVRASYADGALLIHLSDDLLQMRSLAISLFDLSGRQLISTIADNTGSPLRIAVPNLAHGAYILRVGERSGGMVTTQVHVR